MKNYFLTSFLLVSCGMAQTPSRIIIDLTHPFSDRTIYWPTEEGFRLQVQAAGMTEKGYYYAANSFCAAEHGGTHIDAPVHFAQGKATVDQIPLERLIAPAILVDIQDRAAQDRDYQVSIQDLTRWEEKNGRIPDHTIVMLRTGWGKFYPDRRKYLGTERRGTGAIAELHFPGLDPAAARWLAENRGPAAVGIDTASIDRGQSTLFESHQTLFRAGIPAFENVAGLEQLPEKNFQVIALPMKIQGGSGGPLRIVALLDR